jgi:hypothetical protein
VASGATTTSCQADPAAPAWPGEPQTLEELDSRYEKVASGPGRSATTELRIVRATPKDGSEAVEVVNDQQYKLFIVLSLRLQLDACMFLVCRPKLQYYSKNSISLLLRLPTKRRPCPASSSWSHMTVPPSSMRPKCRSCLNREAGEGMPWKLSSYCASRCPVMS